MRRFGLVPLFLAAFALACQPQAAPEHPRYVQDDRSGHVHINGHPHGDAHHGTQAGDSSGIDIPPAWQGPPQNALQAEMRALTSFMQLALVAVANDQLELIPPAIPKLHGAIEATQAGVKDGSISLPQNGDDVEGFLAADDAFHDQIVGLVRAARANDLPAATQQLAAMTLGCTACHERYRFEEKASEGEGVAE